MRPRIDDPAHNDNRRYDYSFSEETQRDEYPIIMDWIQRGSKVIDLGCGGGALLSILKDGKDADVFGVDASQSAVEKCIKNGINARQGSIDSPLRFIQDKHYDYSICNVTIQMVMYPEVLLSEMKRISRQQIISFPNFAYWKNRIELMVSGRMPRTMLSGYEWYSTGHIHQLSIRDFKSLAHRSGLEILKAKHLSYGLSGLACPVMPNLFSSVSIFMLKGKGKPSSGI